MRIFFLLLSFLFTGCSDNSPSVHPADAYLEDAIKGSEYQSAIIISGGAINKSSISVKIMPENSGIKWRPYEEKYILEGKESVMEHYNKIIIYGIPDKVEPVHVSVSGFTLGTMYPGKNFSKDYIIKIRN